MISRKIFIALIIPVLLTACKTKSDGSSEPHFERVDDLRELTAQEYTVNNITAVDEYGRVTTTGDLRKQDKKVGVFYHVWHGTHNTGIFDITQLLENDPESLWDPKGNEYSPLKAFHHWGQPLYGYYHSADPWVISRHVELFTMAGVDYLVYDLTNTVIYTDAINAIFAVLDKYQKQGFNVPKVAFYTNSASGQTIKRCYNLFYKDDTYSSLWYRMDGEHPLIIGQSDDLYRACTEEEFNEISNFFQIRESQWPDATKFNRREGFPCEASMREGTNVEGQWKTVFDNYDQVNNVFVTGWNEWIAQKMVDGNDQVFFVDTFNEPYSRDMEMMKGGYGDNFYLQFSRNIKKYAWSEPKHYKYSNKTIDINDFSLEQWNDVKAYRDFEGDALRLRARHAGDGARQRHRAGRRRGSARRRDAAWMNLMISLGKNDNSFASFNYIINRSRNGNKASIEKLTSNFTPTNVGECDISYLDNVIQYAIPLSLINRDDKNFEVGVKVCDNIQEQNDIQDYYVSGDSAPIGRLSYSYGY